MHEDLIDALETAGTGVGAFEAFAETCLDRAARRRDHAAFLFALATIAQRFTAHYYDRPLSVGESEALKTRLRGYVARMAAPAGDDDAARLAVLNGMIADELETGY